MKKRCNWVNDHPIYIDYHDHIWGKEVHDDQLLFEFLILESFQAGLSWITILKKREAFKDAFENFEIEKVANYDQKKFDCLLQNKNIIRNRLKIKNAIKAANLVLEIQKEYGSFNDYLWQYVDYKPIITHHINHKSIPVDSKLSKKISQDLYNRGFRFIGSIICYSFMQAIGMINDHEENCPYKYK
jgi:3-methyladenine DNA glycosylase